MSKLIEDSSFGATLEEILAAIAIAIISSVISSLLTFKLSLRKFRTEKWWELKAEAYQKVIKALHEYKSLSGAYLDAFENEGSLLDKDKKKLKQRSGNARKIIYRYTDIGAFWMTKEAIDSLEKYQDELNDLVNTSTVMDFHEIMESDYDITTKCLKNIIIVAKQDLSRN